MLTHIRHISPHILVVLCLVNITASARASVIIYSDLPTFQAASNTNVVVNFNAFPAFYTNYYIPPNAPYTEGGVTFTPVDSLPFAPNLYVETPSLPATSDLAVQNTENVLTASGNEHFDFTFSGSPTAIGFDTFTNGAAPPVVTIYDTTDDVLATINLSQAPDSQGFFGVTSTVPIGKIDWLATDGQIVNTGVADFRVGTAVPEPASLSLLGLGAVALLGRRRRA
ncbi:MAG: PEP-CTERM sorting domain-containing protein [Tepidisphaeraceae bacterium]|jgi:hypothetical protein